MKSSGARRAGIEKILLTILEGPQKLTVSARILVIAVEQHWNLRVDSIEGVDASRPEKLCCGRESKARFSGEEPPAG